MSREHWPQPPRRSVAWQAHWMGAHRKGDWRLRLLMLKPQKWWHPGPRLQTFPW